jgi:prophage regulatory protein
MHLLRPKTISEHYGLGVSTLYDLIAKGLLPPLIKVGSRASAGIEAEFDAVFAARAAGASDPDIKQLVRQLVGARPKRPTIDAA